MRDYLGITLDQQTAWPDDDEALKAWRQVLIGVGIYVFKDQFRVENYSGFSLYDDVFPIIYVNNSASKTRQIFTLIHELGHLLFHTSGIDTLDNHFIEDLPEQQKKVEMLCNRFAAEFLLPQKVFNEAVSGHPPTEQTAELLAGRFHVSREFIFLGGSWTVGKSTRTLIYRPPKNGRTKRSKTLQVEIHIGTSWPILGGIMSLSSSANIIRTASMMSS